jgi:hypothetical protein
LPRLGEIQPDFVKASAFQLFLSDSATTVHHQAQPMESSRSGLHHFRSRRVVLLCSPAAYRTCRDAPTSEASTDVHVPFHGGAWWRVHKFAIFFCKVVSHTFVLYLVPEEGRCLESYLYIVLATALARCELIASRVQ